MKTSWEVAADILAGADVLLMTAGAGLGVDGGLSTFRGHGSDRWSGLDLLGVGYEAMVNPERFAEGDGLGGPRVAWAFWSWQVRRFASPPHQGYHLLERWVRLKGANNCFVFTSNIDGHFLRFSTFQGRVLETQGSVAALQCQHARGPEACPQGERPWPTPTKTIANLRVPAGGCEVAGRIPRCPGCGQAARPAVLMYADVQFSTTKRAAQEGELAAFLQQVRWRRPAARVAVLELGAGVHIPTLRRQTEAWVELFQASLVRINPEAADVSGLRTTGQTVGLACGALEALVKLDALAFDTRVKTP